MSLPRASKPNKQLKFVRNCGCDEAQGFVISRALPEAEFEQFVRKRA